MKSITLADLCPIKMSTNPLLQIVTAGFQVINIDGYIYEFNYKDLKWDKKQVALREDYQEIPQIIN